MASVMAMAALRMELFVVEMLAWRSLLVILIRIAYSLILSS